MSNDETNVTVVSERTISNGYRCLLTHLPPATAHPLITPVDPNLHTASLSLYGAIGSVRVSPGGRSLTLHADYRRLSTPTLLALP